MENLVMDFERNNMLKLLCGTVSLSALLIAACFSVAVFLPSDSDEHIVPVGTKTSPVERIEPENQEKEGTESTLLAEDFITEADVGQEIDFDIESTQIDPGLLLYRQPQSRVAVEWFYSQVTGDRDVALAILEAASQFNVPPSLAFALAYRESLFKPDVKHTNVNGSIDRGLFQLNSNSFPKLTEQDFYDARTSAHYGLSHLHFCLKSAGNEIAALAMYNAGATKVQNNGTPQTTLNYISHIESYKSEIEEKFAVEVLAFYSTGAGVNEKYLAKF